MRTKAKQFGKRSLTAFMSTIFLMIASVIFGSSTASAAEIDKAEMNATAMAAHQANVEMAVGDVEEGFVLVDKFTTKESDDVLATTLIYEKQGDAPYSTTGWRQKKVTAVKVFTLSMAKFKWVKITVWGTFSWNGETANVSNADGVADVADKGIKMTDNPDADNDSDCGSNALLGNKYAYVEKRCSATNGRNERDFKLWLDVNRNGDVNTDPGDAEVTEEEI